MVIDNETKTRKISYALLVVEFLCCGIVMQVLLGASFSEGMISAITYSPGMWVLAAVVTIISGDHVHRMVWKLYKRITKTTK